jgi:hypothetical protein
MPHVHTLVLSVPPAPDDRSAIRARLTAYSALPAILDPPVSNEQGTAASNTNTGHVAGGSGGNSETQPSLIKTAGVYHRDCFGEVCDDYHCTFRNKLNEAMGDLSIPNRLYMLSK